MYEISHTVESYRPDQQKNCPVLPEKFNVENIDITAF